ncbi:hypothetical protein BD770DRAFT_465858 [Pilaira anomala]|nr:hypothetical protein BD770DRAFT_465858 [Pilaira anomala]
MKDECSLSIKSVTSRHSQLKEVVVLKLLKLAQFGLLNEVLKKLTNHNICIFIVESGFNLNMTRAEKRSGRRPISKTALGAVLSSSIINNVRVREPLAI